MKLSLYQVDAFSEAVFSGNPAAVVPLEAWLPDNLMQDIASENNLAETAFLVRSGETGFSIRWFTPTLEVDLCGHATLASAYVAWENLGCKGPRLDFACKSGPLAVERRPDGLLELDFPVIIPSPIPTIPALESAIGCPTRETFAGVDLMAVVDCERTVRELNPDLAALAKLPFRGVIVTSPGDNADFVSRFFAPQSGIPEDPATGSAHCMLTPYWSGRTGKSSLEAHQLSRRGARLFCELAGERVKIAGKVQPYLQGTITLPGFPNG